MKKAPFITLCGLAYICCSYELYINATEVINRKSGKTTFLEQNSWMSDEQAVLYSKCGFIVFLILFFILGYFNITTKRKSAIIAALSIMLLFMILFYVDAQFYYSA